MKTLLMIGVGLLAATVVLSAQYVDTRRLITVSGEAEVSLIPDRAVVSVGVQTEGLNISELKATNDKRTNAILNAVAALGIPNKDIRTNRLTIDPVYNYQDGRQELLRYRMYNVVTILVKDIAKVEAVVNAGIAGGSNILNGIAFESSKASGVRDSLRIEATKDAQRRANDMAQAVGAHLGKVVSLQENEGYRAPMYEKASNMMAARGADSGTPVEAGELTVRFTVSAVFELE